MIRKLVWCLFVLLVIREDCCSPTERDLYAYSTLANTPQSTTGGRPLEQDRDAETAETNTRPNPRGHKTDFRPEDISLEDSQEDPPSPEDHVIPYSEHEDPGEVPTRPKYVAPGNWAKPDPKKNIPLKFVPTKSLAQVRGTHTVKVLPRSEAIASASSDEERQNAPRLREVVSKKKTNTIYTEEGYEDSAYDHGGHIRDADFHEGYARKLHDEHGSQSGSGTGAGKKKSRKKKPRSKNSRPKSEEFQEFTDDYSDEPPPNEKYRAEGSSKKKKKEKHANRIYKDMWKRPDVNAKIVAENEIDELEEDLKREDEEAERGSENYGASTERDIPEDYNGENTSSKNSRYPHKTADDDERSTGPPGSFEKNENFYAENYEATTLEFETPRPGESEKYEGSTSTYDSPTTNRYYLPGGSELRENYEATTFNYNYPNSQQSVFGESPTTVNYGDVFWKYFQTKPNEVTSPSSYLQEQTTIQQPLLLRETTTLGPYDEQTPPVALATINGHGPYLLVSENGGVTQNPNQFGLGGFSYFSTPRNGDQYGTPNTIFNRAYGFPNGQGPDSRPGGSFSGPINSGGPEKSGYSNWGLNSAVNQGTQSTQRIPVISTEPSTTRFYDNIAFASTPTYSLITLPPANYEPRKPTAQKDSSYRNNPFLSPEKGTAEGDDDYKHENFEALYNDWFTNKQEPPVRNREQSASGTGLNESKNPLKPKSQGNRELSFFGYKPSLEYTKMQSFIENDQNGRYNEQKSESADLKDFTIMKPPTLRQSVFSDFTLNSYPNVAGYSSVTQESEAAQETDEKKFYAEKNGTKYKDLSQKGTNFKTPAIGNTQSAAIVNRKRLFPASRLLPPAPNSKDNYADMNFANRKNSVHEASRFASPKFSPDHGNGVKNYHPDPKQLARYLRILRLSPRQTRSLDEAALGEEKLADDLIARGINEPLNFTSEDQGSTEHRDVGVPRKPKSRVKRNLILEESRSGTDDLLPSTREPFLDEKHGKIGDNRGLRNRRSHQNLLDASHKIAGDVIDEEIDSRFKSKDHEAVDEDDDDEESEEEEEEEDEEEKREKQIEIDPPDLDYLDDIQDVNDIENIPTTTTASIDYQKYPFYKSKKVSSSSPLKYIIDPNEVPRKTFGGMEFYDSRDKYVQCEEVDPNLEEVLPEEEEPVPNRGPKQNLPRLRGLGDQLDCFKAKYFGENPFDNPLFFERKINQPTPPTELDPMQLVARILELPEENKNYFVPAQSRKPESMAIKRIDNSRRRPKSRVLAEASNIKSKVQTRTRGRGDSNHSKVQESRTEKPQTDARRTRKGMLARRQQITTTESPEIDSVTPYQKEVYDDVMGTIKNLASLYEMFEAQTAPPSTEATNTSPNGGHILGAPSIRNVKTLNRVPTSNGNREQDFHSLGVTEIPFHEEIEGLLPPPEMNKKPKIMPYRTNKVSYNTRVRTESPLRNGDKKIIGYFRTVMVHKRSLDDDDAGAQSDPEIDASKKRNVLDSEVVKTRRSLRSVHPRASSSTTERPKRGRRRKTKLTTTTTTTVTPIASEGGLIETRVETPRPFYTIRSRSRNSKDDKNIDRYGLFTTTQRSSATIDARRNEPRYTEIMRRRDQSARIATTTPSPQELLESNSTTLTVNPRMNGSLAEAIVESREVYESENSAPRRRKVSIEDIEPSSEIYKAIASEFEPEHVEESDEDGENYEDNNEESTDKPVEKIRKYDVHEDVQEDTTPSVVGFPKPTKTSKFIDLETFLSTDPPGYSKAFSDESGLKSPHTKFDGSGDSKENYRNEESKEERVEDDDKGHREAPETASYQEGESSDEDSTESPKTSEFYKEASSGNEDENKKTEQEDSDEKPFFRYDIRPDSPYENFEDDKYSELGPRIHKPAFHHPTFETPEYERKYFHDSEEKEKDKTGESSDSEKYVFPWIHDEEDEKAEAEEKYLDEPSEKYEYPWEKRDRLAKERAERRRDRERLRKLRDFSFLHDDDDSDEDEDERKGSSSKNIGTHVYPWDVYDMPSKPYKKTFWKTGNFDSDETSSEVRPVAKYSSKYSSSKFKLPFAGSEPIETAEPRKIRKSVLKFLRAIDGKPLEPTVAYESTISTTGRPDHLTNRKTSSGPGEKTNSTIDPSSSGSKNNKRISNSRIIPENITTAPRQRSRSRVISVRDRTTLRPFVRTTTESAVVAKAQTTETPVATTRRHSRGRGGPNTARRQPSYKAQESQIASRIVEPRPTLTTTSTTERPVKPTIRSRKRGKPKTVSDAAKTEDKTIRRNQEDARERSTQATTTLNRRRTRPTVTTRLMTTKTTEKNYEKPKNPARVNTKSLVREKMYDEHRMPTPSSEYTGDRNAEDSSPTGRTVEHRSRVSKEEIITKTSFPQLDTMYKVYEDKSMLKQTNANSEDERKSKSTHSGGKTVPENEEPGRNESVEELSITTKETPEHVYEKKEILDKDGHKGMFLSITPKNRTIGPSAVEDELHLKKTRTGEPQKAKNQDYDDFDETETQNTESDEEFGSISPEDSILRGQVLRKIPPRSNSLKEMNDSKSSEYESSEKDSSPEVKDRNREYEVSDESEEDSSEVNFEEDPSRRLYYYLDHKK